MRRYAQPDGAAYPGDLLDNGDVFLIPESGPPVLFRYQYSKEPLITHPVKKIHGEILCLIPFHDMRSDL
jgi:hypothetical protein